MDAAVVGISASLGKRVVETLVSVHYLGLEHKIGADRSMGNIVMVCPSHCSTDGYRNRLWTIAEILNLYLRVCCRARLTRCGTKYDFSL